jgi:hypothetical protein
MSKYFCLSFCCIVNSIILFSQPSFKEKKKYFENYSFSKISLDETGIWAISGDSSTIYHYDLAGSILQSFPQFNTATSRKFTGILAKGSNKVLVATAGDYLLFYDNGIITVFDESDGILNGNINSLYGDLNNTIVGTDSLAYEAKGNLVFKSKYYSYYTDKTIILNDYMNGDYPYAQNIKELYRINWRGANYSFQYIDSWSRYISNLKLNQGEYPTSLSFYYNSYVDLYVATNIGLKYYYTFSDITGLYKTHVPTFELYKYIARNNQLYLIAAAKDGLYIFSMLNNSYSAKILDNFEVHDMIWLNDRLVWLATNKGLIAMSLTPQLTKTDTINFCESNPQTLGIKNSVKEDSIRWYRNDILAGFPNTESVTIRKEGTYYAIITNSLFTEPDTSDKVTFKSDFINYNFNYNYDTVTICKGSSWSLTLTVDDNNAFIWLKDGEKIADQQPTIKITEAGKYSALITNCNNIDIETRFVEVKTLEQPYSEFNIPKMVDICALDTLILKVNTNADYFTVRGPAYYWSSNQKELNLTYPGRYAFDFRFQNISGCSTKDTITIDLLSLPFALIGQNGSTLNASSVIKNSDGQVKLIFNIKEYQWYFNNEPIEGAMDSTLQISSSGLYKVKVTDLKGCSNYSNEYSVISLDATKIQTNEIMVFPNPTNGIFTISDNDQINIYRIDIYNSAGSLVKYYENVQEIAVKCDISNLSNGVYIVRVLSDKPKYFSVLLQK